jgi:hypothetical protein
MSFPGALNPQKYQSLDHSKYRWNTHGNLLAGGLKKGNCSTPRLTTVTTVHQLCRLRLADAYHAVVALYCREPQAGSLRGRYRNRERWFHQILEIFHGIDSWFAKSPIWVLHNSNVTMVCATWNYSIHGVYGHQLDKTSEIQPANAPANKSSNFLPLLQWTVTTAVLWLWYRLFS